MTLRCPNENREVHKRANVKLGVRLISTRKVHKLLKQGCEGYPCNVIDSIATEPLVESVPIVCEFSDVFPEEISSMPLPREVDFCNDLALGATYISKAPSRIAPA